MNANEQIIEGMAFRISADIRAGKWPDAIVIGRRWIRFAIFWARRNGSRPGLEKRLFEYLDAAWPVKTHLPMIFKTSLPMILPEMPTLPALKAA